VVANFDENHRFKIAVAGASGYAGGEFLRLALDHPNLEIGALTAHSQVGKKLGEVQPHLRALKDRELVPTSAQALAGHDVVVLALPHGASGEIAAELAKQDNPPLIIDLGADHRLIDPAAWKQFYGSEHMGTYTYGLPELINGKTDRAVGFGPAKKQRELLRNTREIAVPGCNVIAVTLALQPGIADGALDPNQLTAVLVNGYSGAGRDPKPHLLASEALGSAKPYAVGGRHRHIPEIKQNLAIAGAGYIPPEHMTPLETNDYSISFTPTLAPMSRGILAVVNAGLSQPWQIMLDADTSDNKEQFRQWLRDIWVDAYKDEPFVEVLPGTQWPSTSDVLGANTALLQVDFDLAAQKVIIICAIDNVVKGTAGSAIQSMNLALGLPETTGLQVNGVAP